jgi:hypothetical protein
VTWTSSGLAGGGHAALPKGAHGRTVSLQGTKNLLRAASAQAGAAVGESGHENSATYFGASSLIERQASVHSRSPYRRQGPFIAVAKSLFRNEAVKLPGGPGRLLGYGWAVRPPEVIPDGENATLGAWEVAREAAPNQRSDVRLGALRALLRGVPRARRLPALPPPRSAPPALARGVQPRRHRCAGQQTPRGPAGQSPRAAAARPVDSGAGGPVQSGRAALDGGQAARLAQAQARDGVGLAHRHAPLAPTRLPATGAATLARAAG